MHLATEDRVSNSTASNGMVSNGRATADRVTEDGPVRAGPPTPRPPGTQDPRASGTVPTRLPRPLPARLRATDVLAVGGFVVAVTVGLWIRHGGLGALLSGGMPAVAAIGQLGGLVSALAAMGGLILTSRPRWLERRFGQDRLVAAHRWFGMTTVGALLVHVVADSWAWGAAMGGNAGTGLLDLVTTQPWLVAALAGTLLILIVAATSWRRLRRRIPYETWYFIHLTGYLAVLLGFGHQVTLGSDIAPDTFALLWWWSLALGVTGLVLWSRLSDLARSIARPLRVVAVTAEATGIGSIHVTGSGLRHMRIAGGQFCNVRALTRDLWWQAHPYSVSAAPTTGGIRFTVKDLGDGSRGLLSVPPGTRVLLEGPYGTSTIARAAGAPVVLVAGGVGVAPIRALLEDCRSDQRPVVIVRVRSEADLPHRRELERIVAARNGVLHILTGRREWFADRDPFSSRELRHAIPDLPDRHVFVCGPASLESAVISGMRAAGVPSTHIHHERFGV